MDYLKVNQFYLKYLKILNQKFLNCIFLIDDNEDKKIFKKINDDIVKRAKEIISLNQEQILFIYEYDFLWNKKITSIPFIYFFKGNILLLNEISFVIEQDSNNKSDFFLEISNNIIERKNNIICFFRKDKWSLSEGQLVNKNFFNLIGISNLPIGYCANKKQEALYDYISDNGLLLSYVSDMNYVYPKNKNLDFIISGLFANAFVFVDSTNLSCYIEAFKIFDNLNQSDYIYRYLLDDKNDNLYKNIKLEFVDSILEFENKNQVFFYIKNINDNF